MKAGMRRQWTRSSRAYLAASGVLAVLAALTVHHYLSQAAAAAGRVGPMTPVVEAAKPIARGSELTAGSLRVASIPRGYVPPGSFTSAQQVTGRVALVDLAVGEAVTETRLARVRAGPVASLIPEGYRAFAVPTSLPPGAVVAGDHVDVLATYGAGQLQADTVVDGAEVVLVLGPTSVSGSRGSGGIGLPAGAVAATGQATLVLLVTPEQEQRLAFARAFAVLDVTVQPPPGTG
jgi:Flp pilus assembly protein CpaB